jgi:hypothetical protein
VRLSLAASVLGNHSVLGNYLVRLDSGHQSESHLDISPSAESVAANAADSTRFGGPALSTTSLVFANQNGRVSPTNTGSPYFHSASTI